MQLDNDSVSKHLLYHFKVRKKVTQTKICITLSFYLKIYLCKKSFQNVYLNSKCFYSIYLLSIKSFNV